MVTKVRIGCVTVVEPTFPRGWAKCEGLVKDEICLDVVVLHVQSKRHQNWTVCRILSSSVSDVQTGYCKPLANSLNEKEYLGSNPILEQYQHQNQVPWFSC